MRSIVFMLCVCAASCGGQTLDSPLSPAAASSSASGLTITDLPFDGSYVFTTTGQLNCPATCPPTTLYVSGTVEGTASQLGRFTATYTETVDLGTATGTGTYTFTAANGDQLFANGAGGEDRFDPPNVSYLSVVGTITGGTGRFASATGSLTIRSVSTIDFAAQTSRGTGTLEGRINLQK